MPIQEFNDDDLTKNLSQVLQTWLLYRRLEYKGADSVTALPGLIMLVCPACKLHSRWQTSLKTPNRHHPSRMMVAEKHKVGFWQKAYICKNCGAGSVTYYFFWGDELGVSVFYKVGQYPELEEGVSETLAGALGAMDLKAYKNALRLRNFNLGIGAIGYMRRVVENRMNDLLEA